MVSQGRLFQSQLGVIALYPWATFLSFNPMTPSYTPFLPTSGPFPALDFMLLQSVEARYLEMNKPPFVKVLKRKISQVLGSLLQSPGKTLTAERILSRFFSARLALGEVVSAQFPAAWLRPQRHCAGSSFLALLMTVCLRDGKWFDFNYTNRLFVFFSFPLPPCLEHWLSFPPCYIYSETGFNTLICCWAEMKA